MKKVLTYYFLALFFSTYSNIVCGQSFQEINLRLYDIEYNPVTNKIYGAQSGDKADGHSILVINPDNGEVESIIPVGYDPHVLEFTYDYEYLFIGYVGLNQLHRLHLQSNTLDTFATFKNTIDQRTAYSYVMEIATLPNRSDVAVVILGDLSDEFETNTLCVVDSNGIRPEKINSEKAYHLEYHENSQTLFGSGYVSYSSYDLVDFFEYSINDNGIQLIEQSSLFGGTKNEIEINDDLLFTETGKVFDIGSNIDQIADLYDIIPFKRNVGVMEFDTLNGIIYNVDKKVSNRFDHVFHEIDAQDFSLIKSTSISHLRSYPQKLIFTGQPGRLAMISHDFFPGRTIIMDGSLMLISGTDCPIDNIEITGPDKACSNIPVTLSTDGQFYKYIWSNDLIGESISFNIEDDIEIWVEAFDINGCKVGESNIHNIKYITNASIDKLTDGDSYVGLIKEVCLLDSLRLVVESENADYFEWSTGELGEEITIFNEGTYSVLAYNNPGCTDGVPAKVNLIKREEEHPPKPVLSHSGLLEICEGETIEVTSENFDHNFICEWSSDDELFQPHIIIDETGSYSVRYKDSFGCYGSFSDTINLTVHQLPDPPFLRKRDSLLYTFYEYDKEWFLNGTSYNGYSADSLIATGPGIYHLKSISDMGCYSHISNAKIIEGDTVFQFDIMRGKVYVDYNQNNIYDFGDFIIPNHKITIFPENFSRFTNSESEYAFSKEPDASAFIQSSIDTSRWKWIKGEDGYTINANMQLTENLDFSYAPKVSLTEQVLDINTSITRCNMNARVWVSINNTGTEKINSECCLDFDSRITEGIINVVYTKPLPNPYCWDIQDQNPGSIDKFYFDLKMPSEQFVGDVLTFNAQSKVDNDIISSGTVNSILRCAYDPNDKLVNPAYNSEYALHSDTLHYTIRFQNTGNDTAFTVRLTDQLSDNLDWSKFTPIGASHEHVVTFDERAGRIEVLFENIMLPDSNVNVVA